MITSARCLVWRSPPWPARGSPCNGKEFPATSTEGCRPRADGPPATNFAHGMMETQWRPPLGAFVGWVVEQPRNQAMLVHWEQHPAVLFHFSRFSKACGLKTVGNVYGNVHVPSNQQRKKTALANHCCQPCHSILIIPFSLKWCFSQVGFLKISAAPSHVDPSSPARRQLQPLPGRCPPSFDVVGCCSGHSPPEHLALGGGPWPMGAGNLLGLGTEGKRLQLLQFLRGEGLETENSKCWRSNERQTHAGSGAWPGFLVRCRVAGSWAKWSNKTLVEPLVCSFCCMHIN